MDSQDSDYFHNVEYAKKSISQLNEKNKKLGVSLSLGSMENYPEGILWVSYRNKDGAKFANPILTNQIKSAFLRDLKDTYFTFKQMAYKDLPATSMPEESKPPEIIDWYKEF